MSLNLKALIGKLNGATRNGLEAAAGMCVSLTHYDIEVEHYLTKMLDAADSDVAAILKHFSVDSSRFSKELSRSLEKLKRGNARSPAISPTTQVIEIPRLRQRQAEVVAGLGQVRIDRYGLPELIQRAPAVVGAPIEQTQTRVRL